MLYIGYNPVGKTLEEILIDDIESRKEITKHVGCLPEAQGCSIFVLEDDDDEIGKKVAESYNLRSILMERVELRNTVVVKHNDFFGEDVFRVRMVVEDELRK